MNENSICPYCGDKVQLNHSIACTGLGQGPITAKELSEHIDRTTLNKSVNNDKARLTLPTDSTARKDYPLFRGCLRYFPSALAGIAKTSKLGNDKHNPGEEMHHARGKSADQGDCIVRHLMDVEDLLAAYTKDVMSVSPEEILNEVNQMAWRALAFSQEMHEKFGAPLAPGAKK